MLLDDKWIKNYLSEWVSSAWIHHTVKKTKAFNQEDIYFIVKSISTFFLGLLYVEIFQLDFLFNPSPPLSPSSSLSYTYLKSKLHEMKIILRFSFNFFAIIFSEMWSYTERVTHKKNSLKRHIVGNFGKSP